jgi:DNA-binding FrmR family transcriptional regulator
MPSHESNDLCRTKADLIRRLHCAEGHLRGIEVMIERGAKCDSIVHQTLAVQAALREINRLVLKYHFDVCLRQRLQENGVNAAEREQCLDEVLSLFKLLEA